MNNQDYITNGTETQQVEMVHHPVARRVFVLGSMLAVAGLLGYILYTPEVSPEISDDFLPIQIEEVMVEPSEPSIEERQVIINAMQDSWVQITAEEEAERRAVLNEMDSDYSHQVSVEKRNAIMQAMQ